MSGDNYVQYKGDPAQGRPKHEIVSKAKPLPVTLQMEELHTITDSDDTEILRDDHLISLAEIQIDLLKKIEFHLSILSNETIKSGDF